MDYIRKWAANKICQCWLICCNGVYSDALSIVNLRFSTTKIISFESLDGTGAPYFQRNWYDGMVPTKTDHDHTMESLAINEWPTEPLQ